MQKILIIILFFISFFFIGCGGSTYLPASDILKSSDSNITNPYQMYVEKSLSRRVSAFTLFEEIENKDPLSGADLDALDHLLLDYMESRDDTQMFTSEYQYLVDESDGYSQNERLSLVMISLSAMLLNYDNYILAYAKYEDDRKLRAILNEPESAYDIPENSFLEITNKYNSLADREEIKKMIEYYEDNIMLYGEEKDEFFLYLKLLIEDSPSYQLGFSYESNLSSILDSVWNVIVDTSNNALSLFFNEVSKDIGNTAGLVETRKGKLYEDANVAANIRLKIQPGDILLEKTPFRLTDKLIPGHWGHIAIYIGTEDELKNMGIWDHPVVVKYHNEISAAKVITEALRDGVQLNTIEHFLNIDDLAIMHDMNETHEDTKDRIILALRQVGKEYDFEYNIETSEKIVCSELVYVSSIKIDWETEDLVGINTISPDNVAVKSIEDNSIFSIPLMYTDGLETQTEKKTLMKRLLDKAKEQVLISI